MTNSEKKLVPVFSQFIRLSNTDEFGYCTCFTCGDYVHWKLIHCGHFRIRQNKNTKFNLKNNHPQCFKCNITFGGEPIVYAVRLDEVYGSGTAQQLIVLSNQICKLSESDYNEMFKEYSKKVKQLLKRL